MLLLVLPFSASRRGTNLLTNRRSNRRRREESQQQTLEPTRKWVKNVRAMTEGQQKLIDAIATHNVVMALGPAGSGLNTVAQKLQDLEGVAIVDLKDSDIVRHKLVADIVARL